MPGTADTVLASQTMATGLVGALLVPTRNGAFSHGERRLLVERATPSWNLLFDFDFAYGTSTARNGLVLVGTTGLKRCPRPPLFAPLALPPVVMPEEALRATGEWWVGRLLLYDGEEVVRGS